MNGKVTIITGGSQGIGKAIADYIATHGGDVVIFDVVDGSDAVRNVMEKGRRATFYKVNVADFYAVDEAVNQVIKEMGRIDNLVNNAGITVDKLLIRMKEEDWDRVLSVNLKGTFNCTRAVIRHMLKTGGGIVNISSIAGVMGNAGQSNYAASKAGIIGFTKSIAKEYGERGIRVNAIAPGFIQTKMTDAFDSKTKEEMFKLIPLRRLGEPLDIARVVYFLLSEYGSYITGEVIHVNGGLYM